MIHKVEIKPLDGLLQEIKIDEQEIRCVGYNLSCHVDEIPIITLEIPTYLAKTMRMPMEVAIKNLKEIAKIMDYDIFEDFCHIWHELHHPLAPKLIVDDLVSCREEGN